MTLILKDQNQINPKSVWLKFEEADDYIELFLVHRDSGELVSRKSSFQLRQASGAFNVLVQSAKRSLGVSGS